MSERIVKINSCADIDWTITFEDNGGTIYVTQQYKQDLGSNKRIKLTVSKNEFRETVRELMKMVGLDASESWESELE